MTVVLKPYNLAACPAALRETQTQSRCTSTRTVSFRGAGTNT